MTENTQTKIKYIGVYGENKLHYYSFLLEIPYTKILGEIDFTLNVFGVKVGTALMKNSKIGIGMFHLIIAIPYQDAIDFWEYEITNCNIDFELRIIDIELKKHEKPNTSI